MDELNIVGLSANTRIGVNVWEQRISQRLFIDVSIPFDCSNCADELSSTIDYDHLCQQITTYVESNTFKLIETVANGVAELIKTDLNLTQVRVSVSKPHAIKNASDIRITVTR